MDDTKRDFASGASSEDGDGDGNGGGDGETIDLVRAGREKLGDEGRYMLGTSEEGMMGGQGSGALLLGGGHGLGDKRSAVQKLRSFPLVFWLVVVSCVSVYGVVVPFNNTASSFLLERDYFRDGPEALAAMGLTPDQRAALSCLERRHLLRARDACEELVGWTLHH